MAYPAHWQRYIARGSRSTRPILISIWTAT
ncbi:hypothetical protein ACNKHL_20535 [Shigella flexneri]